MPVYSPDQRSGHLHNRPVNKPMALPRLIHPFARIWQDVLIKKDPHLENERRHLMIHKKLSLTLCWLYRYLVEQHDVARHRNSIFAVGSSTFLHVSGSRLDLCLLSPSLSLAQVTVRAIYRELHEESKRKRVKETRDQRLDRGTEVKEPRD